MNDSSKAVFLSYASQDAEAAKRICEALRAAGVEVWFDQSELTGGDAWDQKIRKQIKECALFVPIISVHTQARREGYFRREWNLAAARTLDMARGKAFLLPVVIDATPDRDAEVPEEFLAVQWTRLPGGATSPEFCALVQRALLTDSGGRVAEVGPSVAAATAGATTRSGFPKWAWAAAAVIATVGGFIAFRTPKPAPAMPTVAAPSPANPAIPAKSVAVLPFKNLSPDKENEFFADGVHEDVITNLGKIRDLKVISRPSMLAYRDESQVNLRQISADLRVATVLTGSVRRAANKVKVAAQLVDARTGEHLWGNDYERELTDVFAIQATIAQEIAHALKATLLPREQVQIARRPTNSQEAYDLFLQARQMVASIDTRNRRGRYESSIQLLERALALDRNFAEAHALLTLAHGHMYRSGFLDPTPERFEKLRSAVEAASRATPDQPEAKVARGNLNFFGLDNFGQALVEYRAAQADRPNDAEIGRRIAFAERRLGRWHDTLVSFERAAELDPRDQQTTIGWIQLLAYLRRFSAAQELAARMRWTFSDPAVLEMTIAFVELERTGDHATARKHLRSLEGNHLRLLLALWDADFVAAERIMAENGIARLWPGGLPIALPKELARAKVAFLRGDGAATRTHAELALAELRNFKTSPRLEPAVLISAAEARVLAGESEEALRDARRAMARLEASDKWDALGMRDLLGQIFIEAGRPDEALDTLRRIFEGPSVRGPEETRLHPIWARLKDDPRFEQILRSAKPL